MSLVETMISVSIGLFLLLGLSTFLTANLASNASVLKSASLNQELRAVMTLMVRDIRRAGYVGSAINSVGSGAAYVNPFAAVNTATLGCILFSYDRNGNGIQDSDEQYGFLLSGGAVMMRTGVGATTFDCTANATNAWGSLSDTKNTNITALTFSRTDSAPVYMTGASGPNIKIRQVSITIAGQLKNDASVSQTFTETVELKNDLFSPT